MKQIAVSAPLKKPWHGPAICNQSLRVVSAPVCKKHSCSGFSLVEVIVAMVIGLLGIIVMMQMFSVFEGQKRTTSGGDDAISSGAVSLYGIQRNIQQSGWGINSVKLMGCSVGGLLANAATTIPLVPLTIYRSNGSGIDTPTGFPVIPAPDPNTEVLLLMSGNGNGTVEGDVVNSGGAGQVYSVHTPAAFSAGPPKDRVVAVSQAWPPLCNTNNLVLTTIASIDAVGGTVTVDAAAAYSVVPDDRLFNLGNSPTVRVYAIRNGNLTVCDFRANDCGAAANSTNSSIWVPIANNIVSLRAQYGRDTTAAAMDGVVDVWDRNVATAATPVSTTATKNTAACGLTRISAVRFVLVARSNQPERRLDGSLTSTLYVTPGVPLWAGSDTVAAALDATEAGAVAFTLPNPDPSWPTWQDFRYKVFQTTVPLRNITTLGVVPEC